MTGSRPTGERPRSPERRHGDEERPHREEESRAIATGDVVQPARDERRRRAADRHPREHRPVDRGEARAAEMSRGEARDDRATRTHGATESDHEGADQPASRDPLKQY